MYKGVHHQVFPLFYNHFIQLIMHSYVVSGASLIMVILHIYVGSVVVMLV